MSYLKLLHARRKSGQQPTMKPVELTSAEKALAEQGLCIQCGDQDADRSSFLCGNCQAKDTIEDIRNDISALRSKILGRTKGSQ
ncbi:MAG: hypothetical protein P8X96_14105 [Desulfobacteraceae bacterium]